MANHSYRATISWRGEAPDDDSCAREYRIAVPGKACSAGNAVKFPVRHEAATVR